MADEKSIDEIAAEAVQAIRRYIQAEIIRQMGAQNPGGGKDK